MFDQTYGLVRSPDDTGAFRGLHGKGKNPRFLSRSSGLALAAAARFTKASRRHSALALVALGLLGGAGPASATCTTSPSGLSASSGTLAPDSGDTVNCTSSNSVSIDNEAATNVTVTVDGGADLEPTSPLSAISLGEKATIINDGRIQRAGTTETGNSLIVIRGADNRIVNRRIILSTDGTAISGNVFGKRAIGAVLENSGIISASSSKYSAIILPEKAWVINSGDILLFSDGDNVPTALSVSSDSLIENEASGRIVARLSSTPDSGAGFGLSAVDMSDGTVLNNAGTILVDGNAETPAVRIRNRGNRAQILNTGMIDASLGGPGILSSDAMRLVNSGTILGGAGDAVAITNGNGSSVLLQQGSNIDGAISVRDTTLVRVTDADLGFDQDLIDFCNKNPTDLILCNNQVDNLPTTATLRLEGTGSEDDLISGFNVIEVRGDGTWTLDTTLQAGSATDDFQTGDFRGPLAIDVQGAGGLLDLTGVISDNPDDGTLAEVEKRGPGTLRLSGTSTSTGVLNLLAGRVDAAGAIPMTTVVNSGTTVFGTGTLGSIRSDGRVAPGNSIGTLTVTGDYENLRNSILEIELDPTASPKVDLLVVNGNVTGIDDLTIEVVPLSPGLTAADYVAANTYTVLTAGSIDGDNPGIQLDGGLPALVDVNVVGTPSADGQVVLNFTDITLGQLSTKAKVQTGSTNHATVVGAIANTATTAPTTPLPSSTTTTVGQAVQTLTNAQLAQLNDVHIEPFSSYQSVSLEDYDMVAGIVLSEAGGAGLSFGGISAPAQLAAATQDVDVTRGPIAAPGADRGVWGSLAFVDGTVDGKAGVGSFDYSVKGLVLGADLVSDGVMRAGVFGALNRMELGEHDTVDQVIEGDSYHVGAYGSWHRGDGLTLSGVVGYAFGDHESTRVVPDVGGFTGGTARAEFDSRGFYIGAEAAQRFDLTGGVAVTPSVSAIFAQVTQDGATESGGGDFNFALEESTADSLMTTVGLTAERRMETASGSWKLLGSAHYHYDWLAAEDAFHDITASNPITGTITQVGQNRGAHGLTAGLGISGQLTESIAVGAGYAYGWNEDGEEHALSASFSMTW